MIMQGTETVTVTVEGMLRKWLNEKSIYNYNVFVSTLFLIFIFEILLYVYLSSSCIDNF